MTRDLPGDGLRAARQQIKYETTGELSCLHSTRQGPSPPPLLSPVLRCGSPRATGPTPWCWSNPSTRRAGRTSRWPARPRSTSPTVSYRSKRPSPGTRTVRSSSRSTCPQGPAWSRTWRTQMFTLTAHLASASCTWHRAGSSWIASTRCRPTSRLARSRSATSPGAPTSTVRRSRCGSARSRTPSSSRARAGRPGSATPRPTSTSAVAAAASTSTAPTAASPSKQATAPFGSAGWRAVRRSC